MAASPFYKKEQIEQFYLDIKEASKEILEKNSEIRALEKIIETRTQQEYVFAIFMRQELDSFHLPIPSPVFVGFKMFQTSDSASGFH